MLRDVVLTGISLVFVGLARLGFNVIALNLFGEQVSDQLNVALSLGMLVALPSMTAFGTPTVRFVAVARSRGEWSQVGWLLRILLTGAAATALVLALATFFLRDQFSTSRSLSASLFIEALVVSIGFVLYQSARNALFSLDRVGLSTKLEAVNGLSFFVTIAALAALDDGELLLWAFAVGYFLFAGIALWVERRSLRRPCPREQRPPVWPIASYGLIALVATASSMSIREIVVLLAPGVSDPGGAAHIALCSSMLAPLQLLPRMLRTVLFAHSAAWDGRGDHESMARTATEANHWLVLLNVPLLVVVVVLARPLVELMGGSATPERVWVLQLLTLASAMEVLATPAANVLAGVGQVKVNAACAVAGLVVASLLWWLLAPRLGLVGLAAGWVGGCLIKEGIPIRWARTSLGIRMTRSPRMAAALVLASICACVAGQLWEQPFLVAAIYLAVAAAIVSPEAPGLSALIKTQLRSRLRRPENV